MRKTNDEIDDIITVQEDLIADDAGKVDIKRGHVASSNSQLVRNRAEAIRTLESRKELTTVTLKAGV